MVDLEEVKVMVVALDKTVKLLMVVCGSCS